MSLISCNSCGQQIARAAQSCPKCGNPNNYTHPIIKKFIDQQNNDAFNMKIDYEYRGDILAGKSNIGGTNIHFKLFFTGVIICLVSLPFAILGMADFVMSYILPLAALIIAGAFAMLAYNLFMIAEKEFVVDFSDGNFVWQSNDDIYWSNVKRFFDVKNQDTSHS